VPALPLSILPWKIPVAFSVRTAISFPQQILVQTIHQSWMEGHEVHSYPPQHNVGDIPANPCLRLPVFGNWTTNHYHSLHPGAP